MDVLSGLNLYNFEEEEYVNSKYVLTSPRSLEACDMLSIKVCAMQIFRHSYLGVYLCVCS